MSKVSSRRVGVVAAVGLGVVGAAATSFLVAQAGHENAVLEAELSGASKSMTPAPRASAILTVPATPTYSASTRIRPRCAT